MTDSSNVPGDRPIPGASETISTGLLEGVRRREPEAWRRLSYLYGPLVYAWCRRWELQPADAEDVVQEVFVTVANRVGAFRRERPGDTFRGWLWVITRNKLGDWLRRRKTRGQVLDAAVVERLLAEARSAEEPADAAAVGGLYRRALALIEAEFEPRSWQAFWRVVVDGQRAAEVAADLHMTRNAVYLAKSRILCRFHDVLGDAV